MGHLVRYCPDQQGLPQGKSWREKAASNQGAVSKAKPAKESTQAGRLSTVNGLLGEAINSVVVSGYVNGIKRDCLIDTGSVVSLVPIEEWWVMICQLEQIMLS